MLISRRLDTCGVYLPGSRTLNSPVGSITSISVGAVLVLVRVVPAQLLHGSTGARMPLVIGNVLTKSIGKLRTIKNGAFKALPRGR